MRLINQDDKLPIQNHDLFTNKIECFKHNKLLPNSIRAIIVGPSNSGKTNVIISLITHPNGLKFENVYLYSKSLNQPKYLHLKNIFKNLKSIGYYTFSEGSKIISPDKAKPNSIFVFDDIACEKHDQIRSYFCHGRHQSIDSFYLGQTYSHIPKQLIRDNANLLLVFKQDNLNLKHIYNDHVNTDMKFEQFQEICSECWKEQYGFLAINKDCMLEKGRYRKGFDIFILL